MVVCTCGKDGNLKTIKYYLTRVYFCGSCGLIHYSVSVNGSYPVKRVHMKGRITDVLKVLE